MKVFARGSEALEQVLGMGSRVPKRGLEALLLAHSVSVDGEIPVYRPNRTRRLRSSTYSFAISPIKTGFPAMESEVDALSACRWR